MYTNKLFESFNNYRNIAKPKKLLKEDAANDGDIIKLYMNTWSNYNVNGADIKDGGWMTVEQAKEFLEKHKEEEPFINDTENVPEDFGIDEYSNPTEAIEMLETFENADNKAALTAIIEDQGKSNVKYAFEVYESGDYTFFEGVTNDAELGEAWYNMVGGISGISNPENYVNRQYVEDYIVDSLDSDEDYSQETIDQMIEEEIEVAKAGNDESFFENYFDYEALGRDLDFEGFYFASTGAIQTY